MKRKGKGSHAWTPERRKRQLATLAAKRNGKRAQTFLSTSPDSPDGEPDETVRMVNVVREVLQLSAAGRAYVLDRIESEQ